MKNLKKILSLVLCLMMAAVLLTSCGKSLKGEWELVDVKSEYVEDGAALLKGMGVSMVLEFTDDEVITKTSAYGQTETETAEYEFDGDTLTIDDDEIEFELKGKKLTLKMGDEEMIFKRK